MPVANPKNSVNVSSMACGGTATVTMSFRSAASLALQPADIVLIMDRSASMTPERMDFAKAAANAFIDLVDGARDGATRLGLASFSDVATEDVPLTVDLDRVRAAVGALIPGGNTNHRAAFEAATALLSVPSSIRQAAVLFTDGETNTGGDPLPAVEALREKGVEIFCIGLATDPAPLKLWASDPDSVHVAYTEEPARLEAVFREIGAEVILAGARDVVIQDQLMPDFQILNVHAPSDGTVRTTGPRSLEWTIHAAGLREQPDTVLLSFDIIHTGTEGGVLPVHRSVVYRDREENTLAFPSPTVEVDCSGAVVYPEACPEPTVFQVDGCRDADHVTLRAGALEGLGRIVQVDVTLKALCPGKRVAVSIFLTELAPDGTELPRGVKHLLVPAREGDACADVTLKCVQFSLPEALDASGETGSICNPRQFAARVAANYVDTDYVCCDSVTVL